MHAFSCFATLYEAAFKADCPIVKPRLLNPTRGETPVRSTHACFPPTHPKTKTSAGLSVDLPSIGSVKKFTGASFLTEIPTRLNISKRTSITFFVESSIIPCVLTHNWHLFVTNDMPDEFMVTIQNNERNPSCSDCPFPPGRVYDWYFCPPPPFYRNVWVGDFTWGSKKIRVDLFNKHISNICYRFKPLFPTIHCYWSVRPDGFYVSRKNSSFPGSGSDWHYINPWPESSIV
jgi:hypothetical protein